MDWIKSNDDEFDGQQNTFRAWLGVPANVAAAGFGTPEINNLFNAGTNWDTTFAAKKAHDLAALPITAGKQMSGDILKSVMRPLGKVIRARHQAGLLTDAQVLAAGMRLLDPSSSPAATPTTRPILAIHPDQRLEHKVTWTDETTPGSRGKPAGMKDMELRVAVVAQGQPAPADPEAYDYYRVNDPASPNIVGYDPADGGKLAWMIGCWTSTRGERGPWSAAVSETIRS